MRRPLVDLAYGNEVGLFTFVAVDGEEVNLTLVPSTLIALVAARREENHTAFESTRLALHAVKAGFVLEE